MNIKTRIGTRQDLEAIRNLVIELAVFEKEPDAVIATLEDYQNSYDEGLLKLIVAEMDSKIMGMCLGYLTFSTWKGKMMYLEDFYVTEEYRRYGVGQLLWNSFIKLSKDLGCKLLKWQVLDWNEVGLRFYEKNNATIEKNWWNGKIFFND
jgi:GNAT superfamily N-acetyltransferase